MADIRVRNGNHMSIFRSLKGALGGEGAHQVDEVEKEHMESVKRALAYGDVEARWNAIRAAGELGDAFIEPLIQALDDEHWIVRRGAGETLAKIGLPAVPPLIEMLGNDDESVRREITRACAAIGEPATDSLIRALSRDNPLVRQGAAEILGEMQVKAAVAPLIETLKDREPAVRREAASALRMLGSADATDPLVGLLGDESGYVRIAAAEALCSLGDRAIDPLVKALAHERPEIRQRAGLALASIGMPAVEPLIAALRHEDPLIRQGSAIVLGRIADPRSIPGLIVILGDKERRVRQEGVRALAALGYPAITPLVAAFREGNTVVLNCSMEALWLIGGPSTRPLVELLSDQSSEVRRRTALLLGEIGDPAAVEGLSRTLADQVPSVRREGFEALEKIRRKAGGADASEPRPARQPGPESEKKAGEKKKPDTL